MSPFSTRNASWGRALKTGVLALIAGLLVISSVPKSAEAAGVIKRPGAHNRYEWELEPQLVYRHWVPNNSYCGDGWNNNWNGCAQNGFGAGLRVNIPFMHNGPITTINNNIGISFGASTTWHGYNGYGATVTNIPVAFQWNFYFTDIISVLGEAGLNTPITFYNRNTPGGSHTTFNVEPLFQGGGRFQFGKVGILVRVGWPMMSVGANFQF